MGKVREEEHGSSTAPLKGAAAARQLPGSHAGHAGAWLPACPVEEDDPAPLGWAASAGPGGPGKWLSAFFFFFLFLLSVLFVLLWKKNTKAF
jgi:hypothetical protein